MEIEKDSIIKETFDEEEMGMCKCGKKASVRSYGGETGDYCFDCYFEMLRRINNME
jgi:hypothetical protein